MQRLMICSAKKNNDKKQQTQNKTVWPGKKKIINKSSEARQIIKEKVN